MARNRLTPLQETEARRVAAAEAKKNKKTVVRSDEEKAAYRERIGKAKDALTRSVGTKGDHVTVARAAIKDYLRRLDEPKQPELSGGLLGSGHRQRVRHLDPTRNSKQ